MLCRILAVSPGLKFASLIFHSDSFRSEWIKTICVNVRRNEIEPTIESTGGLATRSLTRHSIAAAARRARAAAGTRGGRSDHAGFPGRPAVDASRWRGLRRI